MDPELGEYRNKDDGAMDAGRHDNSPTATPHSDTVLHRDFLGRVTQQARGLARYISPTYAKPFQLIVQATPKAFGEPQGKWRRTSLRGNAYQILKVSVWAVGDLRDPRPTETNELALMGLRVILVFPAMAILVPLTFKGGRVSESYPVFFGRSWDYPKYARNLLDANPEYARKARNFRARERAIVRPGGGAADNFNSPDNQFNEDMPETLTAGNQGVPFEVSGALERLLHPKRLMTLKKGHWILSDETSQPIETSQPYIVLSYAARHFPENDRTKARQLERIAEDRAKDAGVEAYWLDRKCIANEQPKMTEDIHRICDVFRGARRVYAVVPDLSLQSKQLWGSRMWCLPEALLCSQQEIIFCSPTDSQVCTKCELADKVWTDGETTRLLAEHYSGLLTLSRLELISLGLEALSSREASNFYPGDLAYALMSLLRYRPRVDPTESLFQALARLSLANDSDRIVERAVCLLPDPAPATAHRSAFVLEDTLGAKLWDIEPLCQVAGVGDNDSVFLDGCQAASIRWKNVPRIYFHGRDTWKKQWARNGWRTAPLWFLIGCGLASSGSSTDKGIGAVFLILGIGMLLYAPWGVQRLYSGKVWGSTPWLIGFEGVLPIKQVERLFFGNAVGRLRYAPSANLHSDRDASERIGRPPAWAEHPYLTGAPRLPTGYHWFTVVDTGPSMHVHVFMARLPPTVALICGREGGMLRTVLCSYEAHGNMLRKESVLRMETPMLSMTKTLSWVRLSQG